MELFKQSSTVRLKTKTANQQVIITNKLKYLMNIRTWIRVMVDDNDLKGHRARATILAPYVTPASNIPRLQSIPS